ncbi:unnamed protein product [Rhizophagus irregularis]|nr:unnamed protein product [Rhizophagus irregularis]
MIATIISNYDENFLKEFLKDFYRKLIKIIDTNNLITLENTLIEWIKNIDNKDTKIILESMQNHKDNELLFSSIIGFFYQHGIGCIVDKNKSLDFYILTINNNNKIEEEYLNQNFTKLLLEEKNDINNIFNILKSINIIIGKFLLSLFIIKILFYMIEI